MSADATYTTNGTTKTTLYTGSSSAMLDQISQGQAYISKGNAFDP